MLCIACAGSISYPLCPACRAELSSGPRVVFDGGLRVVAAYRHHGAARRLIHRVKYEGLAGAAALLADAMTPTVPPGASCLVPVPRAVGRRVRYGVDPALELARRIGASTGLDVIAALRPAWWWPRHAVRAPEARRPASFRPASFPPPVPPGAVLVDDVVTTGATLLAAVRCIEAPAGAITATAPSSLVGALPGSRTHVTAQHDDP